MKALIFKARPTNDIECPQSSKGVEEHVYSKVYQIKVIFFHLLEAIPL